MSTGELNRHQLADHAYNISTCLFFFMNIAGLLEVSYNKENHHFFFPFQACVFQVIKLNVPSFGKIHFKITQIEVELHTLERH